MFEWLVFALIGALAGTFSGLLGLGGGIIIVPSLLMIFTLQNIPETVSMHMAVVTSLMTIIITSTSSSFSHHRYHNINWLIVKKLAAGLMLGGLLGAYCVTLFSSQILQYCFAVYAFIIAIRMWLPITPSTTNKPVLNNKMLFVAGSVIGSLSALVGIGGGSLTVPYLVFSKQPMQQAVATSAACGVVISLAAISGFLLLGSLHGIDIVSGSTSIINWQAFLGIISTSILFSIMSARWVVYIPILILKRIFSSILLLTALILIN